MASSRARLSTNAEGDFFVDASCIDCGTCRWMAPAVFCRAGPHSCVRAQPRDEETTRQALMALISCPTGSIGVESEHCTKALQGCLPRPIDGPVHHCGYHAEISFGAASWLIVRPEGNVMVDSPRFTIPLLRRIEAMGGIRTMVLTHADDVADHHRYAKHFGCTRVMHADDVGPATKDVERKIEGRRPVALADDLVLIPVPGHTKGSVCLLHQDRHLFSGDHLAWDLEESRLVAYRDVCWYDWGELVDSMARLAAFRFQWVLPGHGAPCHLPEDRMHQEMMALMRRLSVV